MDHYGFMGAGKSTVAAALARACGRRWFDLDREVEARAGLSVTDIFVRHGESEFRRLEQAVLLELLDRKSATSMKGGCVISLGGGTLETPGSLEWVRSHGPLIYLQVPIEELIVRLERKAQDRPLWAAVPLENRRAWLIEKLAQRSVRYEQAHLTIVTARRRCADIVAEVITKMNTELSGRRAEQVTSEGACL